MLSWIYGTVSPELMEVVCIRGNTVRTAWIAIEQQFLGNRETRALHLDTEFHNFMQGDLTVSDYCRKMKSMDDALADLGEYIPDHTLVLNVLRGLNGKFTYMSPHFKRQRPFPTFGEVRAYLLLEELTMTSTSSTASTALVATAPYAAPGAGGSSAPKWAPSARAPTRTAGQSGSRRRRRRGNDNGKTPNTKTGSSTTWPSFYNPWTGTIQMWPDPPSASGGSQPRARPPASAGMQQQQQALLAFPGLPGYPLPLPQPGLPSPTPGTQPLVLPTLPSPWTPWSGGSWDQQSLANAFSTVSLNPPPATTEWVMDSGASSHMTPDTGNISLFRPPCSTYPSSIIVGNGSTLPVTSTGHTILPGTFYLNDVLVAPTIIKSLISVRQFTTDNNCSVVFDLFGLSVKDLRSRNVIVRCNSSGPLYSLHLSASCQSPSAFLSDVTSTLLHCHLGHPG